MRIQNIKLKNVGPFENETIEFKETPNSDSKAEIHIFTGPNGSGKTTLLHGLLAPFYGEKPIELFNRFRKESNSDILLDLSSGIKYSAGKEHLSNKAWIEWNDNDRKQDTETFEEHILKMFSKSQQFEKLQDLYSEPDLEFIDTLDFICFAYSSYRGINDQVIESITEINSNPFRDILSFHKKDENLVVQWLANSIAKDALNSKKGDRQSTNKYRKSISILENVIGDLLDAEVQFDLQIEPLSVVLLLNYVPLNFDILPDGLRSIISWLGDLLMRLDRVPWGDEKPIVERNILLFLDEIEVHLHPKWQMKVLPIVQKLFSNAQIFVSTHSPFVVNSVDDAWVYKLDFDEAGNSVCKDVFKSETGKSVTYVLKEIFGVEEEFGGETEQMLDKFFSMRDDLLSKKEINEESFKELIKKLLAEGIETQQIVGGELRQIKRITKKEFQL